MIKINTNIIIIVLQNSLPLHQSWLLSYIPARWLRPRPRPRPRHFKCSHKVKIRIIVHTIAKFVGQSSKHTKPTWIALHYYGISHRLFAYTHTHRCGSAHSKMIQQNVFNHKIYSCKQLTPINIGGHCLFAFVVVLLAVSVFLCWRCNAAIRLFSIKCHVWLGTAIALHCIRTDCMWVCVSSPWLIVMRTSANEYVKCVKQNRRKWHLMVINDQRLK